MMVISIVVLLTPYAFITKNAVTTIIVGCYIIALYYIVKNIVVYNQEKNKILLKQSDIPQIIKKESQDEMVKIEKERLSQLKQKEQPKRKRGRPKKV